METELKPCPFCGGEARTYQFQYEAVGYRSPFPWGVQCTNNDCIASGVGAISEGEVIQKWNARHVLPTCAHRNGETTAPTMMGRYWFSGTCHGAAIPEAMINVVADDNALGWYPIGDTLRVSYGELSAFAGRWWGPVVAPWEQQPVTVD